MHAHTDMHNKQLNQFMWMLHTYIIYSSLPLQCNLLYIYTIRNSLHTTDNTAKGLISKVPPASGVTGDTVSNKVSMHP